MAGDKILEIPKLLKDANNRQYLPGELLGTGGFACCWKTRMIDRREAPEAADCALKAVKAVLPKNLAWRFKLELAIQSKLHHPNVVELYRAFTSQDITYVALELCPNGSLTDMMKRRKYLTMGEIRRMLIQLCGAVKYLHERDVVHRDIKAGNIFLDADMNVKLGDFGLAAIMEPGDASIYARRTTFCGTPNYIAPEILCKDTGHGISVDIWAIGVLAYFLAVGRAPFHSKTKEEIYERLRKGEYSWPELSPEQNEIPEDLRHLVSSLLVEEAKRPTPDRIVRHTFFTRGFIPNRLDPLCRSRRPKWARVGTMQENTRIYESLCRSSGVGLSPSAGIGGAKHTKSLAVALAEEYASGVKLQIPLKEGRVYLGRRSPGVPVILEDQLEDMAIAVPEEKIATAQPGVLAEKVANSSLQTTKLEEMKPQALTVGRFSTRNELDRNVLVAAGLITSHKWRNRQDAKKSTKKDGDNEVVVLVKDLDSAQLHMLDERSMETKPKKPRPVQKRSAVTLPRSQTFTSTSTSNQRQDTEQKDLAAASIDPLEVDVLINKRPIRKSEKRQMQSVLPERIGIQAASPNHSTEPLTGTIIQSPRRDLRPKPTLKKVQSIILLEASKTISTGEPSQSPRSERKRFDTKPPRRPTRPGDHKTQSPQRAPNRVHLVPLHSPSTRPPQDTTAQNHTPTKLRIESSIPERASHGVQSDKAEAFETLKINALPERPRYRHATAPRRLQVKTEHANIELLAAPIPETAPPPVSATALAPAPLPVPSASLSRAQSLRMERRRPKSGTQAVPSTVRGPTPATAVVVLEDLGRVDEETRALVPEPERLGVLVERGLEKDNAYRQGRVEEGNGKGAEEGGEVMDKMRRDVGVRTMSQRPRRAGVKYE